ncbi:unnamed protein product [Triticum turgidum subsp. durum]|uniref:Uncharacterized protein n=2 Tax=Triticum TaxID=4564 RepID=A0A9R1SAS2_TRITD|nr:unnamed protein product [Triticum aestivum]VAH86696.1 unnamed protein product [Triticum turgidum subsp. durum]
MSFHGGSSSGTGGDDGPSAWPSSLSMPETEELYRFGLLVAAAIPPVVPQAEAEASESSDDDVIDWER